MKNNTRYKGNTNNTCVIIFLRNSQRCYFAWDNLQWDFCYVSCCSSFFCCVFILLLYLHLSMFFILLLFLLIAFRRHPSPFRGLSPGFLHPILYFQPSSSQSASRHFHFQQFRYLLAASAMALSGHFLPTGVFYLTLLHRHFNLRLSRLLWEPAFLPWSLQGFILILETQTRPICLFDSQ